MARKKASFGTTARRPPALRSAAAALGGRSGQLVARRDVHRAPPIVDTVATVAVATTAARQAVAAAPRQGESARRESVESALLQLVSAHTRVLVIGRETWPLSRSLASAGCRVSVVETRQDVPAGSGTFSDRVIVGDPDALDLAAALDRAQFDSVVAIQLLEHVRNPVRILTTLRKHLSPDGCVVAAVPNIMHGRIRLGFLTGRSPAELLAPNSTSPSHWYDAAALHRTFERAGFVVTRLERQTEAFDVDAVAIDGAPVPAQLVAGLMHDADATTHTFAVVAHPFPLTGRVLLDARVRELAQAHDRALQQMKVLAERGESLDARYDELKRAVDGAVWKLDRIGADLQRLAARDARVQAALTAAHQRLLSGRIELEAMGRDLKRFGYEQLILRVRSLAETTLPRGALALVVSKGDERLLAFDGRRAWHFLRNDDGVYAGHHPADGAAATAALRRWRAAGAGYLIVPQVAFWWLDHYTALRDHLERHARVVARDERTAVIYALGKPEPRR